MAASTQKNPTYESWRWKIFAITWLGYAGFYLTRKSFSVASIGLKEDFGFTNTQLGYYTAVYLWTYMLGQFFWGVCGDKFGPRKIVLGGLLCSSLVGFVSGVYPVLWILAAMGFAQGLCQSTGWSNLVKNMSSWFSQRERGTVMGWWCTNYAVGGLIASPFAGWAAEQFGSWRWAFFAPALVLLGIFILFLIFQRDKPEDVDLPPIEEYHDEPMPVLEEGEEPDDEPEGSWKVIGEVLSQPTVWVMGIVYFCLKPTRYAILFWGPVYVNEQIQSAEFKSALISAMFELAGPLGIIFAGFMSDKVFSARRMPIAVLMLAGLSVVLIYFNELALQGQTTIAILFFMIGFLLYGPDSLLTGTAAMDFGTRKGAATAAGFINGLGSFGAAIGGGMAGWISDNYGWDVLFNGFAAMTILAALLLAPFWNATPATSKKNGKSSP